MKVVTALYGRVESSNLPRTIRALTNQTYPLEEIIYLDDASTDSSTDIAEERGVDVERLTRRHPVGWLLLC